MSCGCCAIYCLLPLCTSFPCLLPLCYPLPTASLLFPACFLCTVIRCLLLSAPLFTACCLSPLSPHLLPRKMLFCNCKLLAGLQLQTRDFDFKANQLPPVSHSIFLPDSATLCITVTTSLPHLAPFCLTLHLLASLCNARLTLHLSAAQSPAEAGKRFTMWPFCRG